MEKYQGISGMRQMQVYMWGVYVISTTPPVWMEKASENRVLQTTQQYF